MISDRQCQVANDQTVTTSAGSTDGYDIGAAGGNIGAGEPIEAWAEVTADMTAGGTSLKVAIVGDTALPIDSSSIVLYVTEIVLAAVLVAGYQFKLGTVPTTDLRYLGIMFTADGTFSGGGTISAGFIKDRQQGATT